MNWAYRLINATEVETHISAPIQFHSAFRNRHFSYHLNTFQRVIGLAENEWKVRRIDKLLSVLFHSKYQKETLNYCHNNNIDIVHFHFATVAIRYPLILNSNKYKKVVSFYGYDYDFAPHQDSSIVEKYKNLFMSVDLFLTEGNHGRDKLVKMGCPPHKIEVLHLGISLEDILATSKNKSRGQLNMIQPATFTPKKGIEFTISAFHKVFKSCPNLRLTLVGEIGDATYHHSCLQLITRYKLETQIKVLPFIEKSQWLQTLSKYDVLIQPSVHTVDMDCEGGAPVSLIDAQALGLPIISTIHCDIPEVVEDEITGRLCEEKNTDELSQAIEYFYNMDSDTYQTYSDNARNHILKNYDITKSGRQLTSSYQRLVS